MKPKACLVSVALGLASVAASAQTIYRCGNEYTRVPCVDGKAVDADSRNAQRVAEGRQVSAQERRLGNDMARDRRLRESALRPAAATSLGPARPPQPSVAASASLKPKKNAKGKIRVLDEGDFTATVPMARKGGSR